MRRLIAFALFLASLGASAQTIQTVSQVGALYGGGQSIDVSTTLYHPGPGLADQLTGHVYISGFSAPGQGVNISASVASVVVQKTGTRTFRAVINTNRFFFVDLGTGRRAMARAVVIVDNQPPRGNVLYQVIDGASGVTLRVTGDTSGSLAAAPITTGTTIFRGY